MNRKELLDELNPDKGRKPSSLSDPFDELALKGLRQSKNKSDLTVIGHRLDRKLDQRYGGRAKFRSLRPLLAIAASVLLLLAGWGVLHLNEKVDGAGLAFQLDPNQPLATMALGVERDVAHPSTEVLSKGLRAYEQADFSEAADLLKTYVEQQPQQYAAQLFLGHALLADQAEAAIPVLQNCMDHPSLDQNYRDYAQWFLAWAYLRTGQRDLAKPLLSDLANGESICAEDAQHLLKLEFSGE